jgi:tRNA pseudouridine65 synthase
MKNESHSEGLRILYRDDELVAIDKPCGAIVHRTRGAPQDSIILINALGDQLEQEVYPVHRLDRQTSGVMVFALSKAAAQTIGQDVREGRWKKSYLGLCRGPLAEPIEVDHPVPEGEHKRSARTDVTPLEQFCGAATPSFAPGPKAGADIKCATTSSIYATR